jgi:diguanylate cyclase (GGDEF)-like protein/PAS domain S-box-containing protein
MIKGVAFVTVTSLVIFFIMNRYVCAMYRSNANMRRVLRKMNQVSRENKRSANELDAILNNSLVGMAFVDSDMVIRRVNSHFCEVMGQPEEHFVGVDVSGVEEERCILCRSLSPLIDGCREKGQPMEMESQFHFPDGSRKWLQLSITKIRPCNGMNGFVVVLRDITVRKTNEERVAYLSYYDFLTSLPNRRFFYERLDAACKEAKRYGCGFGVLYLDVNNFKYYNDSHGHEFGDTVLKVFAETVRASLRESDVLARIGGDEFAAILNRVEKHSSLEKIVAKLNARLAEIKEVDGTPVVLTASIGFGLFPADGEDVDRLLGVADRNMYAQKERLKSEALVQ